MDRFSRFVGIDVSKARLDVHVLPAGHAFTVAPDPAGIEQLLQEPADDARTLVVLEATGGLQERIAVTLAAAGLATAVVNPRQVRDGACPPAAAWADRGARATGRLAKTDRLDAQVIARFAQAVAPAPRPLADSERQALVDRIGRRRQLVEMRAAEKTRRSRLADRLRAGLDQHVDWLTRAPGGAVGSPRPHGGRRGTGQPRQRNLTRLPGDRRRTRRGPPRPLHGNRHRDPLPSRHSERPSAAAPARQARQGRHHRLHAQASHHHQRHGP